MNLNTPAFVLAATSTWLMLLFGLVAIMASRISRPDLVFAITVRPDFRGSPEGKNILRRFTWSVLMSAVAGITLTWLSAMAGLSFVLLGLGWLSSLGGLLAGYVVARRQVAPHRVVPSAQHEAEVRPRDVRLAGGWLGQAGPLLVLAVSALYLIAHWGEIPARFPIHWGLNGEANGWGTRGPAVFFGIWTGALTCLVLAGFSLLVVRETRRIHSTGAAGTREARNLKNVQWILLLVSYWLAMLFGGLSLLPLGMQRFHISSGTIVALSFGGELILITIVVAMACRAGQGGWRLGSAGATTSGSVAVGDRTPDECWKGGLIYWNPNDPAMLVEKRFGYGWTLNFGNRRSWFVLGGILLFSVGTSILAIVFAK